MVGTQDTRANTLIVANPGTGKTTALAKRVVELLSGGAKESDILCITFTNKAATEMRKRIDEEIAKAGLKAKSYLIDVHTFHSYAYDYLGETGLGYELASNNMLRYSVFRSFQNDSAFNYSLGYVINDLVPKTENAIRYLKSFGILPGHIKIGKAESELEASYQKRPLSNVTLEEEKTFLRYFVNAYERYESEKDKSGSYIDYNDMLIKFIEKHDAKKRYKHVLVDELQDVNELEASIAMLSGENLFLVGDRKQAIFGFQGGSLGSFRKFEAMNGFTKETKVINYRSLQPILDYSKKHFLSHTEDKSYMSELEGLQSSRKEGKAEVKVFTSAKQINAAVALFSNLRIAKYEKTAIITRTNGQLMQISRLLDKKGIGYSTTAGSSTSDDAKAQIIAYLKGMLFDDIDTVANAFFTPFSGLTLKEAFEASELWAKARKENRKEVPEAVERLAKPFLERKKALTMDKVKSLFNEVILPISLQIGKEYYITAQVLNAGAIEFFDTVASRNREAFFDYLSILEENYEPVGEEKDLLLTTVHKAKGREFDNVIYVPVTSSTNESFIDMVVYSIIKAALGVDVRAELAEEQTRVDFVAFTRAKDRLYIIANPRNEDSYKIEGFESEQLEAEDETEPISTNYDEAYALFVNGRYEDARSRINAKDSWLLPLISGYFSSGRDLSYTTIEQAGDPYQFLKNRILGISEPYGEALSIGSRVHEIAEKLYKGTLEEAALSSDEKRYLENIKRINKELEAKTGAVQTGAEVELKVGIKDIYKGFDKIMGFKAFLDAVYETNGAEGKRYVILDYKTDRSDARAPEHRRQLAVYKRVLAASRGIDENNISIAIGFVGLRGNINTSKLDWKLDLAQEKGQQIRTFEKHLERFLAYKDNPKEFVNDLLKEKSDEPLFGNIARQLKEEVLLSK